ncbi:hypothetical protein QM716_23360 [Rhodococcus sp. IEGM 1409]|uniref:hypothetical protein n=1 Tax=Rhodococcus sp. IEGM 1409 TaxID=3047082 RepID=UPI0024B83FE5|nr:hypothetical protein [Rhodococcus sp. IEGM 1409]MDI9902800.1 hypothetical protein [Rhodococcus sp. IEGM 1409]
MKSDRRLRRTLAGVLAAGALLTGAAGVIGVGIALTAAPAHATPEDDCAAVRARDHQIYLNLIASLPPGSPIPPEIINPCLSAPSTTATAAPTTTVGLPGAQAPGGGPNVGANAPTNFPTYNGTPIVPVPTIEVPPIASESSDSETGVGAFPNASASAVPSPTPTPGEGTTTDRGPGPVPAATPNNAPTQSESAPTVAPSGLNEDDGRDRYLELVLVGAAAFTAGGIGVRGRRSPFGPRMPLGGRTPESMLSQAVGTLASPLTAYAKGGQSKITVTEPGGGRRTFFLIHDATSSHEAEIPVDVPPGGHMTVNPDGSVTVFDADGNPVSVVAAPWAYDANGNPVPTDYEVRDGRLIQKVYADEATAYPILADPPEKKAKAPASVASKQIPKGSNTTSKPNSMTPRTSPRKPQNSGNTNSGNTSGGNTSAPNSMTQRTSAKKPPVSAEQQAVNQLAAAHGDVPDGFTGNAPIKPGTTGDGAPNSMTPRTSPQGKPSTDDNWTTQFGPLNVIGGIVDTPGQMAEQATATRTPNVSSARGIRQGALNGVKGLAKPIPALGLIVTGAAIASDLTSENGPSAAESVATNVGGTVAAAAVGGAVLAVGAAPVVVAVALGVAAGYAAAWAISKFWD